MKKPSNSRRSTAIHETMRAPAPVDRRKERRFAGLSRWKALERETVPRAGCRSDTSTPI
jgi:hypothetical protein